MAKSRAAPKNAKLQFDRKAATRQARERMAILPGRLLRKSILLRRSMALFKSCPRRESKLLCAPLAIHLLACINDRRKVGSQWVRGHFCRLAPKVEGQVASIHELPREAV